MKFHIFNHPIKTTESSSDKEIQVETIYYDTGEKLYSYSYYFSDDDGTRIKHGAFVAYYRNSNTASEGTYEHGAEHGLWREFHENSKLAAEGHYEHGKQRAGWQFWNEDGSFQTGS